MGGAQKPVHDSPECSRKSVFRPFAGLSKGMIRTFDSFKDSFSLLGCQFGSHHVKGRNGTRLIRRAVDQIQSRAGLKALLSQRRFEQAGPQSIRLPPTEFRRAIWVAENFRPTAIDFNLRIKTLASNVIRKDE
jgi:hypothetical protein